MSIAFYKSGLTFTLYPNGEFGVGKMKGIRNYPQGELDSRSEDFWRKRASELHDSVIALRSQGLPWEDIEPVWKLRREALVKAEQFRWNRERLQVFGGEAVAAHEGVPLGLSSVVNSHKRSKTKASRGTGGLTSYGKRMIRQCAYLIESGSRASLCTFATCTVPTVSDECLNEVLEKWSEIVRRFTQELGRLLKRRGMNAHVVYCTEIQEKRYERTGQPVPHLHLLFRGRKRGKAWAINCDEFTQLWRRIICGCVSALSEVSFAASTNLQRIKKSVSGYLAKYLSKGCFTQKSNGGKTNTQWNLIRCWWGATGGLKRVVSRRIRRLFSESAQQVYEMLKYSKADECFVKDIKLDDGNGGHIWLGAYGKVSKRLKNEIRMICDCVT